MLTRFGDIYSTFSLLDDIRRRMDRVWEDVEEHPEYRTDGTPRFNIFDTGNTYVVTADVPGLSEKDLRIELHGDTLSVVGERKVVVPAGYSTHRQERSGFSFHRNFHLPAKVDAERVTAHVKDGVLTLSLEKAAQEKPRQIAVRAQ